jgi:hypothetical protein
MKFIRQYKLNEVMAEGGAVSQREAARLGRAEQLRALRDFEAGKIVTFKVMNNPKGFRLVISRFDFLKFDLY